MTNTPQITEEMKHAIIAKIIQFTTRAIHKKEILVPDLDAVADQILDIINPPQKVEPVELNCFIYQQANGQIYFTVNRVRNDTEMDHFTVRWSGKNTAEIVKEGDFGQPCFDLDKWSKMKRERARELLAEAKALSKESA